MSGRTDQKLKLKLRKMKKYKMVQLYSNENFPIPVVIELRNLGYDVLTIQETGKDQQSFPDRELLKFATENKRAVLTFNRKHFIALHKESPDHEGIIVCTFDLDFRGLAQRIHEQISTEIPIPGKLIKVNQP